MVYQMARHRIRRRCGALPEGGGCTPCLSDNCREPQQFTIESHKLHPVGNKVVFWRVGMGKLSSFLARHLELVVILVVIVVMVVIDQWIVQKITFINFYYIPVLFAAYVYGKRIGGFTALFCVAAVVFCLISDPARREERLLGYTLGVTTLVESPEQPTVTEPPPGTKSPLLMQKDKPIKDKKARIRQILAHRDYLDQETASRTRQEEMKGLSWEIYSHIAAWGAFLFLSGVIVGALSEERQQRLNDLRLAYTGVIEILSKHLQAADKSMRNHLIRVSDLATDIAVKLDMGREEVECVQAVALLHDMAKLDVSIELIERAAALSTREKEKMGADAQPGEVKMLAKMGHILTQAVPILAATAYLQQGRGERSGQKQRTGEAKGIALGAQIVDMADVFVGLTEKDGKTPQEALDEIAKGAAGYEEKILTAAKQVLLPA